MAQKSSLSAFLNVARSLEESGVIDVSSIRHAKGNDYDELYIGFDSGTIVIIKIAPEAGPATLGFATFVYGDKDIKMERFAEKSILDKTSRIVTATYSVMSRKGDKYVAAGFTRKAEDKDSIEKSILNIIKDTRALHEAFQKQGYSTRLPKSK